VALVVLGLFLLEAHQVVSLVETAAQVAVVLEEALTAQQVAQVALALF